MYHFHVGYISRSSGNSACAHAAYISASRIHDDRTGDTWDYSKKKGEVLHTAIMAPEGSPEWVYDSECLWNAVESFEDTLAEQRFRGHKDPVKNAKSLAAKKKFLNSSKTQYIADIALPLEIVNPSHLIALSEQLIQECYVNKGLVVQYAIHLKAGNPHLHICAAPRPLDIVNQRFKEVKHVIEKPQLAVMREQVAEMGNRFAETHGYSYRWDHRSYQDQGLEIVPTRKRGWAAERLETLGGVSRILSENREIQQQNIEILLEKPEQLIHLVAQKRAVFTRHDLEEEILKRVGGDGLLFGLLRDKVAGIQIASSSLISRVANHNWPERNTEKTSPVYDSEEVLRTVASWTAQVLAHEDVVTLGESVKGEQVYTHQAYQTLETEVKAALALLKESPGEGLSSDLKTRALVQVEQHNGFSFSQEQTQAVEALLSGRKIEILTGRAGTGKTTVLMPVVQAYREAGYTVIGTSFQGKVADMLSRELGIEGFTLDQLCHRWHQHDQFTAILQEGSLRGKALLEVQRGLKTASAYKLTSRHVVIVDEGNMVPGRLWRDLLKEVSESGALLRLVADNQQIKTLLGGDLSRLLEQECGAVTLRQIHRQKESWMQQASSLLNDHRVEEGMRLYLEKGHCHFHDTVEGAKWGVMADYLNGLEADPQASRVVMAYRNAEVHEINEALRARLKERGLLGQEFEIVAGKGKAGAESHILQLAIGERIVFTRNDATEWLVKTLNAQGSSGQGVRNGTPGIIEAYDERKKTMKVRLEDGRLVGFDTQAYAAVAYGYAMTVNKAEGETYAYSHVLFDPLLDANSLLIAMTRHRLDCQVRISRTHAADLKELVQATGRGSYRGILSDSLVSEKDRPWFDLARSYVSQIKAVGILAAQGAAQQEAKEVLPSSAKSALEGTSLSSAFASPSSSSSASPASENPLETAPVNPLWAQMKTAVQARQSLAQEVLLHWKACAPSLTASGITRAQVEIHAGVRERLLSDVELKALHHVEDYRRLALATRQTWEKVKVSSFLERLTGQSPAMAQFEALREQRGQLAYEIASHPALYRPFFKVTASENNGVTIYTSSGGTVYQEPPAAFMTALKHAETYINHQKEAAYVRGLSPSEQHCYGTVLRYRAFTRQCGHLYQIWQEAEGGLVPAIAEGALKRLQETRRERDLLAYRMMDSVTQASSLTDYSPFLETLNMDTLTVLKHGASGEVRLLCLKRNLVRTVEERVAVSSRLLSFMAKEDPQASLTPEQKGWAMVIKEHNITLAQLRFEQGYGAAVAAGSLPHYQEVKQLEAAWVDLDTYRKTHRDCATRWTLIKTRATKHVQDLQDTQIETLNRLDIISSPLVRTTLEEQAMIRLQATEATPRVLASVTTDLRQVVNGYSSPLSPEMQVTQQQLMSLQSHLRRGRSGYLSLAREQLGGSLGYEELRQQKLAQAWQVMSQNGTVIEGVFGQEREAQRLHKESHEFDTQQKVKNLSTLKGPHKATLCAALWAQGQQEASEGQSLVKSSLVREGVLFETLSLYALAYDQGTPQNHEAMSLYSVIEGYLKAKADFSTVWKQRCEAVEEQLADVKEAYSAKREAVILALEGHHLPLKGYIPWHVDRLVESLTLDEKSPESQDLPTSALAKTTAFVASHQLEFDQAGIESLSQEIAEVYQWKEEVQAQRLALLYPSSDPKEKTAEPATAEPDRELMRVAGARNRAAHQLMTSPLGERIAASEDRSLLAVVTYSERYARRLAALEQKEGQHHKPGKTADKAAVVHEEIKAMIIQEESLPDLESQLPEDSAVAISSKPRQNFSFKHPSKPRYSLEEVERRFSSYGVGNICRHLLGPPNPHGSSDYQLRYGTSNHLVVSLQGRKAGLWMDFKTGESGNLFQLVQREEKLDFKDALIYVAQALRVTPEERSQTSTRRFEEKPDTSSEDARRLHKVKTLVAASGFLNSTLGERYLKEHRAIQDALSSSGLRFMPSAWHSRTRQSFPALAALAQDVQGTVTAIQLIYLDPETAQKANVDLKKQSFGKVSGSYVHIQKGEGAVFVAEGVETALSVREAGVKGDIYASLGIANFKNIGKLITDKARPVILCADQDGEGSPSHQGVNKAVATLKDEGFTVSIIRPDFVHGKEDFNDVLQREGVTGVRAYFKEHIDPLKLMSDPERHTLSYLEKSSEDDEHLPNSDKRHDLHQARLDPEGTWTPGQKVLENVHQADYNVQAKEQDVPFKDLFIDSPHDKKQEILYDRPQRDDDPFIQQDLMAVHNTAAGEESTPDGEESVPDIAVDQSCPSANALPSTPKEMAVIEDLDRLAHLTERQQEIFERLKQLIENSSFMPDDRKETWIQFGLKDPQGTWRSFNNLLIQEEIIQEQRQERYHHTEQLLEQVRNPTLIQDAVLTVDDKKVMDPATVPPEAQGMLETVRNILSEKAFKTFESSLLNTPEAITQRCLEIITSHQHSLKLEADVGKFIQLTDTVKQVKVLSSPQAKDIFSELKQIALAWKDDDRFLETIKRLGNTTALMFSTDYINEQKQSPSQSQGYALER